MRIFVHNLGWPKQKPWKAAVIMMILVLLIGVSFSALAVSTVDLTLKEGNAAELNQLPGSITLTRSDDGNLATPIEVWVIITGTASFGSDFANPDGLFNRGGNTWGATIAAGETSRTVTFVPNRDNLIEGEETITLQLTNNESLYIIGTKTEAEITITDDVAEVTMELDNGSLAEAGPQSGSFTVTRSTIGNVDAPFEVWLEVTGTAVFGSDFPTPDGFFNRGGNNWAVSIDGGDLTATVTFVPNFDNVIEGDETIIIKLLDIGVAYTVVEQNIIEMVIADFVETVFKDSFEDPEL